MTEPVSSLGTLTHQQIVELGSGADVYSTKATGDIPSIVLTDGPHGVRKVGAGVDHLSFWTALPATCFPPAVALSQTWSPDLASRVAVALGRESLAADVQVLLGPGVNIKRDPRGGRNFEYFSEDPFLTGELASAWVSGLQSVGVGASLKHFAVNNQETDRMRISADVDPRTLREIYLRAFQKVVEEAQPWTVMAAYNRINGSFGTENRWLLTDVLRGEWGFEGVVVSDWAAVVDRVAAVAAGMDLQMPADGGVGDEALAFALADGAISLAEVERAAARVAELARKGHAGRQVDAVWDVDAHHLLAQEVARSAIVLLRDDHRLLPLASETEIAVIGDFAVNPRYQGGGSSHVNASRVDEPLAEIRARAGEATITFAPGFSSDTESDPAALRASAVEIASRASSAVVFLGLYEHEETEGIDRADIDLPQDQLHLLREVLEVQPRTVVVLSHGGVLRLAPVVAHESVALLDGALLGQGGGAAIADVLFGLVNPSGKLAETVPERIQDVPAYPHFPGEHGHVRYGEEIFVGYRWYDARDIEVTFPFGHGLSYTTFAYRDFTVSVDPDTDRVTARVTVVNTGARAGRETVQIYAGMPRSAQQRPPQWLVGFGSVELDPAEARVVEVQIPRREFEYWNVQVDRWVVEPGSYQISVGASSRDIRDSSEVSLAGDEVRYKLTPESSIAEIMRDPIAGPALDSYLAPMIEALEPDWAPSELRMMLSFLPFVRVLESYELAAPPSLVERVLEAANEANGW